MKGKGKIRTLLSKHGIHVPVTKKLNGWHMTQYQRLKRRGTILKNRR